MISEVLTGRDLELPEFLRSQGTNGEPSQFCRIGPSSPGRAHSVDRHRGFSLHGLVPVNLQGKVTPEKTGNKGRQWTGGPFNFRGRAKFPTG